ncbi:MAG: tetratricopeptide repeat protein [Burkholderiaceae bacterium]|nr:tetratricopeptide repeat protein [Burkholderiaceae bacterium]
MPTPKEMQEAMREMQRAMDSLTPEQRKMIEDAQRSLVNSPGAGDEVHVPARDAARIAKVPRQPLTGAQLKAHVASLQPKLRQALSREALRRAEHVEDVQRKAGGDLTARLRDAANGLAAWGAWPEATFLMGKVALASGHAQDLNNLAAFLTMQKAPQAALPILITLDARYPNNSTILNNLGQAWFELGELKEAERVLILAVRRSPNHPQANVTKSHIEEARGDKAAAQASMRAAIRGGFSEDKAQRLARLGGRLQAGDVEWKLPMPQDALGLSRFVLPPYPDSYSAYLDLKPAWTAFWTQVRSIVADRERRVQVLAAKEPWRADVSFRGPLAAKARALARDIEQRRKPEADRLQAERRAALQQLDEAFNRGQREIEAIHEKGRQRYRNVPGGYQYDYTCAEVGAAIDKTFAGYARLESAERAIREFERRLVGELAYLDQFQRSPESFELAKLQWQGRFLTALGGGSFDEPADRYRHSDYRNICIKGRSHGQARRGGGTLADFDDLHCQHIVDFTVHGIGSIQVHCNRMETKLEPFGVPLRAGWTEDLNKDRVLTASVEVDAKGMTVGGRGEFDEQGLTRGGVSVSGGVDTRAAGGPLEIGVSARGGIGVEFDRSGVTDVRIEAGIGAQVAGSLPGTQAGTQAGTKVSGTWSWNAGASAGASGNFDRSVF